MNAWQKPSPYSVAVILAVLAIVAYAVHANKLTLTEGLLGALLGVVTWITKGARPGGLDGSGPSAGGAP